MSFNTRPDQSQTTKSHSPLELETLPILYNKKEDSIY